MPKKEEKNAIKQIEETLWMTQSKKTPRQIIGEIDRILELNGEERENAMKEYFLNTFKEIFREGVDFRLAAVNDPALMKKDINLSYITGPIVMNNLAQAMHKYIEEKGSDFGKDKALFGISHLEKRDSIVEICSGYNALEDFRENGRKQGLNMLNEVVDAVKKISESSRQYNPVSRLTSDKRIEMLYIHYDTKKEQYSQRSGWWKFFHPIQSIKTNNYLKNTKSLLEKVGFNIEEHGSMVQEKLASEPPEILKAQMDMAKDSYKTAIENDAKRERLKNTPEIRVARDKLEQGKNLNKNPETSFKRKVQHILDKYSIPSKGEYSLDMVPEIYRGAAKDYDMLRDTAQLENSATLRFLEIYRKLIIGAVTNDMPINPKEILKDTQEYFDKELNHYTVVYEHPEAKDLVDKMLFAGAGNDLLERRMLSSLETHYNRFGKTFGADEAERIKQELKEAFNEAHLERENAKKEENQIVEAEESAPEVQNAEVSEHNVEERTQIVVDINEPVINDKIEPEKAAPSKEAVYKQP